MGLATEQWHGYIALSRIPANLNEVNWSLLVAEMGKIKGLGSKPQHQLTPRISLDGDIIIYEARFQPGAVDFLKFGDRLYQLFGITSGVSYTTITQTYDQISTVIATYKYLASNRIRVALFGCEDDEMLCNWGQSKNECREYVRQNDAAWNPEVTG